MPKRTFIDQGTSLPSMPKATKVKELITYLLTCPNAHKLTIMLLPDVPTLQVCLSCNTPYSSKEVK
jgi:hypothetical protein